MSIGQAIRKTYTDVQEIRETTFIPPHSIEAEQAVLGSLILSKAKELYEILDILKVDDLFNNEHKLILQCIIELDKNHVGIDIITVSDRLNNTNKREDIWIAYLGEIAVLSQLFFKFIIFSGVITLDATMPPTHKIAQK